MSDEDLLIAVQAGDTDSLSVLVSRWERPLYRFVYRLLLRREDARDVCQETFLRILRKADRFERGSRFSTWMYQIALNLCRDQIRRRKRWSLVLSDAPPPESVAQGLALGPDVDDPSRATERREASAALLQALDQIPPEQREVLVLKEFEGLKFREIAELLRCPESTVKSRMYYGLNGLRQALTKQGFSGRPA
ncbi:MAG TPA: sigma-70 family RNA polymerase sigma factor [Candidatus Polarisedimenticolaceae bacterium]|nr:sigma-70 family RNA polymerase sigma factor [Candidatus Polarisedimenticolaceae bacterium]